ncbi:unnamed protein product, partial [Urochloa humidicola]
PTSSNNPTTGKIHPQPEFLRRTDKGRWNGTIFIGSWVRRSCHGAVSYLLETAAHLVAAGTMMFLGWRGIGSGMGVRDPLPSV